MSVKLIENFSVSDIKESINYYLDKAIYTPEVREFALQITDGNPDKISAIYDWIRQNVEYVGDPIGIELFISPIKMIRDYGQRPLAGDCDDQAILATALYRSLGIESNVVLLDTTGQGINHAISRAMSEKLGWLNVDPTDKVHPLGWEIQYISKIIV